MPITQLVAMVRSTPPQHAASLVLSMPVDRKTAVLAQLRPADIVRLLGGARQDRWSGILSGLSPERFASLFETAPAEVAAGLLGAVPRDQVPSIVGGLPASVVPAVLEALPAELRETLLDTMGRNHAGAMQAVMYERSVLQSLGRTNVHLLSTGGSADGMVMLETFGRLIAVAVRYKGHGSLSLPQMREVEQTAARARANGALTVTNVPLADEVHDYLRQAFSAGWLIDAVTWVDSRHDGLLQRALVGLVR